MQASPLTWWRSSCQTSASDLSLSPPRSVSWWLRLTATQAPPTSRPSHGYDPSLFISIERCDWVRGNSYWCHSLKKRKMWWPSLTSAKALLSTQREFTSIHQISKELPASWSLIQVHLQRFSHTETHRLHHIRKKKDSWFALFPNLPKNIKTVLVFTCPRLHW